MGLYTIARSSSVSASHQRHLGITNGLLLAPSLDRLHEKRMAITMDEQIRLAVAQNMSNDTATVDRWMAAGGRKAIQAAIDATIDHPLIDLDVLPNQDVSDVVAVLAFGAPARLKFDVPVRAVLTLLGTRGPSEEVRTWRNLFSSIHAVGWEESHFDYFERPIAGATFLPPGATGELTMVATGGIVQVSNAAHRMVGGAYWLGARDGERALLREVNVLFTPINPSAKQQIKVLQRQGYTVEVATCANHSPKSPNFKIRALKESTAKVFHVVQETIVETTTRTGGFFTRFKRAEAPSAENWLPLHPRIVRALIDDNWLPECCRAR